MDSDASKVADASASVEGEAPRQEEEEEELLTFKSKSGNDTAAEESGSGSGFRINFIKTDNPVADSKAFEPAHTPSSTPGRGSTSHRSEGAGSEEEERNPVVGSSSSSSGPVRMKPVHSPVVPIMVHRGSWAPKVLLPDRADKGFYEAINNRKELFEKGVSPETILQEAQEQYPPSSSEMDTVKQNYRFRRQAVAAAEESTWKPSAHAGGDKTRDGGDAASANAALLSMVPAGGAPPSVGSESHSSDGSSTGSKSSKGKRDSVIASRPQPKNPMEGLVDDLNVTEVVLEEPKGIIKSGKGSRRAEGHAGDEVVAFGSTSVSLEDIPSGASATVVGTRLDSREHPLLEALYLGKTKKAEKLISKLNGKKLAEVRESMNHYNALHIAAHFGYDDIVRMLISKGMPINRRTRDGATALTQSAMRKHENIVHILVESGAKLNKRSSTGTALSYAILAGKPSIVRYLLDKGADPTVYDKKGWTPLMHAIAFGQREALDMLLDVSIINHQSKSGKTALHVAALYGQIHTAHQLLARGAILDEEDHRGWTPFMYAVEHGHHLAATPENRRRIVYVERKLATMNPPASTPVKEATPTASPPSPSAAKKKGWFGWRSKDSVAAPAAQLPPTSAEQAQRAEAAVVNSQLYNELTEEEVAKRLSDERTRTVAYFLQRGSDIHHQSPKAGWTPLLISAALGHTNILYRLLELGCSLKDRLRGGHTALTLAISATKPSIDTIQLLLANGVDPNEPGDAGGLPLMFASSKDQLITTMLLEHGANINAVSQPSGYTPLLYAIENGSLVVVQDLIHHGADTSYECPGKDGGPPITCRSLASERQDMQHFFQWYFSETEGASEAAAKNVYDYVPPTHLLNYRPFKITVKKGRA